MGGHGGGDKDAAKENFKKKSMFGFVVMCTAVGAATFASRHKWTQLVIRETLVNQTAGGAPKYAKTEPVCTFLCVLVRLVYCVFECTATVTL